MRFLSALSPMAGEERVVGQMRTLFEHMGKGIHHMGPAGAGQHTKMSNQIIIATNMIGMVEGLLYAKKCVTGTIARTLPSLFSICGQLNRYVRGLGVADRAGLSVEDVLQAVGGGAAGSWSINNLGPRIARGNLDPGFIVEVCVIVRCD